MTVGPAESGLGVPRARPDSNEKVRGATRFAADRPIAGMLHARIVPSLYAHARILRIDASAALDVPGVVAVLTAADLPIKTHDNMRMYEPLARDEALFAGQPVALVVAESESAAADAVELVSVEVEQLPVVQDLEAAMRPDSPRGGSVFQVANRALSAIWCTKCITSRRKWGSTA